LASVSGALGALDRWIEGGKPPVGLRTQRIPSSTNEVLVVGRGHANAHHGPVHLFEILRDLHHNALLTGPVPMEFSNSRYAKVCAAFCRVTLGIWTLGTAFPHSSPQPLPRPNGAARHGIPPKSPRHEPRTPWCSASAVQAFVPGLGTERWAIRRNTGCC